MEANKYWYLRSGDFRPEELDSSNAGYPNRHKALEQLAEAHNLFFSQRDAYMAYEIVSGALSSLRIDGCNPQSEKRFDNTAQPHPTSIPENGKEGKRCRICERQSPNVQNAIRQPHGNSLANVVEIQLKVLLHS